MRDHAVLPIALLAACYLAIPAPSSAQNAPIVIPVDPRGTPAAWTGDGRADRRAQITGALCLWGDAPCTTPGQSRDGIAYVAIRVNGGEWRRYTGPLSVPRPSQRVEVKVIDTDYTDNFGKLSLEIY
jgi:hypothetical protein